MTKTVYAAKITAIIDEEFPAGILGSSGKMSGGFDYEGVDFDSEIDTAFLQREPVESVAVRLIAAGEMIWE